MTNLQCLCQICTCGHYCSRKDHTEEPCILVPACILTEQEKFRVDCATAVPAAKKPKGEYKPLEAKIASSSTYRSDYVAHELMQRPPKVSKPYVPPEGHMRCTSSYTQDYPTHIVEKHTVTKTQDYHPPTAKMFSQSVYKDDFQAWNTQKRQPYKLCDNLKLNKGKFETTTTSKDAYCHKDPVTVRENFKPAQQTREILPFDGTTNYRSQYVTQPMQLRKPREKPTYRPTSSAPVTRIFTSHQDYKGLPTEPAKSFKPKVAWENNLTAFEGISEFRDKFKAWPLGPKFHHKAEKYRPPEGRMVFLSTAHADYVAHECQRPESVRPPVQAWEKDKEPIQAKSTMKEDYKAWDTVRRPSMVQKEELERPKGAYEKTTTTHSAYTPKTAQCAISFKPPQKLLSPKSMVEEASVCHSSYTAKEVPPCPAQNGSLPGFEYHATGAPGHRLYRTISVDTLATLPDGGTSVKPPHSHSRITCRVPSRTKRAP